MKVFKKLFAAAIVGGVAVVAYLAGSQTPPVVNAPPTPVAVAESGLIVPTVVAKDTYPDITVVNPTKVLLGEEKVPDYLLVGPAEPAEGLVIPTLPRK